MKRLIFLIFTIFIISCSSNDNFYNDKKEIMLRSNYNNNTFVSYLGVKNNEDVIVIASKFKVIKVKLDDIENNFTTIKKDEFDLPYSSNYLYFYKTNKNISKNEEISCEIVLENNTIIKTNLRRISKSLNYNL